MGEKVIGRRYGSKKIKLSRGMSATVDETDLPLLEGKKWFCLKTHKKEIYYARAIINGKPVSMHRYIMGAKNGEFIDHINGDGLDNRRSNLRFCTISENNRNKKKMKNNTSGFTGITFEANKWRVKVAKDCKDYNIGYFTEISDAILARNNAVKALHKEFAKLT